MNQTAANTIEIDHHQLLQQQQLPTEKKKTPIKTPKSIRKKREVSKEEESKQKGKIEVKDLLFYSGLEFLEH